MTKAVALCRFAASTRPIAALALISCLSISRAAITDPACGNSRGTGPATPCLVHSAPSEYNERVLVVDRGIYRAMRFDSIDSRDQSRIRPGHPEELPMPYLRSAAVGLVVPPTLEHLLVIGLGGGAFPRFVEARFPDVEIDAVEIDPVVARIARDYFGVAESNRLRIHVADAVAHVKQQHARYDFILLDAYGADDLPAALTSSIFLGRVRDQLADEGVLAVNIAVGSDFRARALIEKIRTLFSHCLRMRSLPSRNDVLLLSDTPLPGRSELLSRATSVDVEGEPGFGLRDHIGTAQPCQSPPD
ncbi:MAG: fused MFS/spermidine synthase [Halieaceae bacterium]|jgi:spermidine synthase|nr:fused MFS/spermidine synthase [Halieaceae bacterium]